MRRVVLLAVIGFAVWGLVLAFAPFDRPHPPGSVTYGEGISAHCTSPIVSAWHESRKTYVYLPVIATPSSCRGEARHRLELSGLALGISISLGVGLRARREHEAQPSNV